jgi:hypothetical protein
MGKIIRESTDTIINEHGEFKEQRKSETIQLPTEPPYIKLYIENIVLLKHLPRVSSNVLLELIRFVDYDGEINLNPNVRKKINLNLGFKNKKSLSNSITKLVKKDIIFRIGTGSYILNPNLFAKGYWSDIRRMRDKYLTLKIEFSPITGQSTLTSEFNKTSELQVLAGMQKNEKQLELSDLEVNNG